MRRKEERQYSGAKQIEGLFRFLLTPRRLEWPAKNEDPADTISQADHGALQRTACATGLSALWQS